MALGFMIVFALPGSASAYTETTLYAFCTKSGCPSGAAPNGALAIDSTRNLFGTTEKGGSSQTTDCSYGCGTVYEIKRSADRKAGTVKVLHAFCKKSGCKDGNEPVGGLIIDTAGNLYGVTEFGGKHNYGVVFKVSPTGKFTDLYDFCSKTNCADGENIASTSFPLTYQGAASGAPYDGVSPLYGTTASGGTKNEGVIYKLVPGAQWSQTVLYNFCSLSNCLDGMAPNEIRSDASGNLYGTTLYGGAHANDDLHLGAGTIFKFSGGSLQTLYSFCAQQVCADGEYPRGSTIADGAGNIFGTTTKGGVINSDGTLFKLTSGGTFSTLYEFCPNAPFCTDGRTPAANPYIDADGNLFGTTTEGGSVAGGVIYEMKGTSYQVVYSFCELKKCRDGSSIYSSLVADGDKLFGVALEGGGTKGVHGQGGTVFELLP